MTPAPSGSGSRIRCFWKWCTTSGPSAAGSCSSSGKASNVTCAGSRRLARMASRWLPVGCAVARIGTRRDNGKLFFDFNWGGRRCREQTSLLDTPANRQRTERVLRNIVADIEHGSFVYEHYFPDSPRSAVLPPRKTALAEGISAQAQEHPPTAAPLFR